MQFWQSWIELLGHALELLSIDAGLGTGLGIVALTVLLRMALLPISWSCAWSACIHQRRVKRLQPELTQLRDRFGSDAARLAEATFEVYRRNGVAMFNLRPVFGSLAQMPILLGMFQLLRSGLHQARFLWIESLARPDFWVAVISAVTTAAMMAANPELPEQTRTLMIWIPAIVAFAFAIKFASALALYWAVSNCFAAAQTSAVHYLIGRRERAGTLNY